MVSYAPPLLPPLETWPAHPFVSVLVAAWNESGNIDRHIRSFLRLRYPTKELILCAGGQDGTYEIARSYTRSNLYVLKQNSGEGKQKSLRRCYQEAQGSIIMLTDADCAFSDDSFQRLIFPFVQDNAQVVTGISEPHFEQRNNLLVQYQWFNDAVWASNMPEQVDGVLGRNCAISREVLEAVGQFNADVSTGTDYYLSRLLTSQGFQIHAAPSSRVTSQYPMTAREYLNMWRRWNKNLLIHGMRFGTWREFEGVIISSILACLVILPLFLIPIIGLIALFVPFFLLITASVKRYRRLILGSRLAGVSLPWRLMVETPYFAFLDFLAAICAVYDSLHPNRRTKW